MSDRPQKAIQPTAAVDIEDADGTVTAWSVATFALSVSSPLAWVCLTSNSHVSCARLLLLAGLFVVSPRLLIFMAGEPRTLLTPLEAFLAFQFGILLCAVSLGVLVNVREPPAIPCIPTDNRQVPFRHFVHSSYDRRPKSKPALSSITHPRHCRITPDVPLSIQHQRNRDVVYRILHD